MIYSNTDTNESLMVEEIKFTVETRNIFCRENDTKENIKMYTSNWAFYTDPFWKNLLKRTFEVF